MCLFNTCSLVGHWYQYLICVCRHDLFVAKSRPGNEWMWPPILVLTVLLTPIFDFIYIDKFGRASSPWIDTLLLFATKESVCTMSENSRSWGSFVKSLSPKQWIHDLLLPAITLIQSDRLSATTLHTPSDRILDFRTNRHLRDTSLSATTVLLRSQFLYLHLSNILRLRSSISTELLHVYLGKCRA